MNRKKIQSMILAASVTGSCLTTFSLNCVSVFAADSAVADEVVISLDNDGTTVDGQTISSDETSAVYAAHDIIYYEDRDTYDSGNTYGEGEDSDKHTEEEAASETVIHITKAGTYKISGTLQGQIAVDLGEDAKEDADAVVTLIFDNADVTCDVAPAVIFYNVYECDTDWTEADAEGTENYVSPAEVDTTAAGANIIIADGSVNNLVGSYVAKVYKDNDEQKKLYKYDGAVYSAMSMNVSGETSGDGVLNITGANEGLDSHVHLTINSGTLNITSQDDAINTDEDNVSVMTINGGNVNVAGGMGSEGDGIDSNGYIVVNGGTVVATAKDMSDSGLDSTLGTLINGGTVFASGSSMDGASEESLQPNMFLQFTGSQSTSDIMTVKDTEGNIVYEMDLSGNEFFTDTERTYTGLVISSDGLVQNETYTVEVNGTAMAYTSEGRTMGGFGQPGMGMPNGEMPQMPDGEMPELPEGMTEGELPQMADGERPELPEGMNEGEMPEMPNGEMPELPEGMSEGEMPQMPNGQQPPSWGNGAARGDGETAVDVEASSEFTLSGVVSTFGGVQTAE